MTHNLEPDPDPNPPPRAPIGYRAPRDDQVDRLTSRMSSRSLRDQIDQIIVGLVIGFIALPGALCSGAGGRTGLGIGALVYLAGAIVATVYTHTRGYGVGLLIAFGIVFLIAGLCFHILGAF